MTDANPDAVRPAESERRPRGRPRQLSLARITAAARKFSPKTVTMQAVADELGVDPKALYYHVRDREGLRELLALDVFESAMAKVALPLGSSWQDVSRSYARALRDAVTEVGWQTTSVRRLMPAVQGPATLVAVERVLEALVGAGFDIARARDALTLIADTGFSAGLNAVMVAEYETHPNVPGLIRALNAVPEQELPLLREVVAGRDDSDQLEFQVDVVLAGLERLLGINDDKESPAAPPA